MEDNIKKRKVIKDMIIKLIFTIGIVFGLGVGFCIGMLVGMHIEENK